MARHSLSLFRPARPTLLASVAVAAALTAVTGAVWMASSGVPDTNGPRAVRGLEPNRAALLELRPADESTFTFGVAFLGAVVPQSGSQATAGGSPAVPVQPGGGLAVQPPALPPPPSPPPGDPDNDDPLTQLLRTVDDTIAGIGGTAKTETPALIAPATGSGSDASIEPLPGVLVALPDAYGP